MTAHATGHHNTGSITAEGFHDQPWAADALCAEIGGDLWFPEKDSTGEPGQSHVREAKAICGKCPVRDECLQWALETDQRFGLWGGVSPRERAKMPKPALAATGTDGPTASTAEERPAPRSYGQTYIGDSGHRPIPMDVTPRPKSPRPTPRPSGLDWSKHTAPGEVAATAPAPGLRCRWCREATPATDLIDDVCGTCRDDAVSKFTPPKVGGVNAAPAAVLHSGGRGAKDAHQAVHLSTAGDTCAPDENHPRPAYATQIAMLMRDTEGHPDPAVKAARKVVANALVGLNKALATVPPAPATPNPPAPRPRPTSQHTGHRVNTEQIVRLYEAGCPIPALAKDLGHSKNTIRAVLLDRGVELRDDRKTNSGGNNRVEAYPDALVADVRRLYLDEQMSQAQTAAALGITTKVVQSVMAKHQIPARPAGRSTNPQTRPGHNGSHAIKARLDALGCTAADVRVWATGQGLPCPTRGSIPNHLVDQYEAAHTTSQETA